MPKPRPKPVARDGKRRGQVAELAFMHKAADLGFAVTKPYGDDEPYDFILDSGRRLWRVQVKSTESGFMGQHYYCVRSGHCNAGQRRKTYTSDEIDFLVVYIVPCDAWYVIPVSELGSRANIYLYPENPASRGRFERYREAWCLMACPRHGKPRDDIAVEHRCQSCPSPQPPEPN